MCAEYKVQHERQVLIRRRKMREPHFDVIIENISCATLALTYTYTYMKVFLREQVEAVNIYCYNVFIHTCVRKCLILGRNTATVFGK